MPSKLATRASKRIMEKAAASQEGKRSKLSSGEVDTQISHKDISMWTSTKKKFERVSFVWDFHDAKDFLKDKVESESDNFKGGRETRHLLWQLKIKVFPCPGTVKPQVRIGLQLNNQSLPQGLPKVKGIYQLNILSSDWTILSATKSTTPTNFVPQQTHWNSVFPTSDLDQYLIGGNCLRIHVELAIETGLKHQHIDPKTGLEMSGSESDSE